MTQLVRAYGQILRFPKEMSDEAISKAILDNEHDLNPDYRPPASSKVKDLAKEYLGVDVDQVSKKISDSRKSVADLAEELAARGEDTTAPQVPGAPVRQSTYNSALLNDRFGIKSQESLDQNGILGRIRKTADEDIRGQGFQENLRGAITDAPPEPEGGFIPSAASIAGRTIKGVGRVGSDYLGYDADNSISAYGQKLIDENPVAIRGLEDIQDRPFLAVKEALGNSAPTMGGMVGAKAFGMGITSLAPLTGPAAPIIAAVGQAVQWLGPAAIAALPSYSGIRDKQILNDPANEADGKAKAIAALGAGTVGVIEQAFGPQQWAMAMLTKEGRAVLARKFAATTTLGAIAKGAIKGGAIESSEEIIQNPVEQLASFDDPTTKENIEETIFGGAMGAIGGGVMGGGIGGINQIARNRDAQILIEKRKLAKQHADAINRRNDQQGHDDILNAGSVDEAIQAANNAISRNPVTKDDILRTVDPTLADIERLTGLKPSESIEQAINQAQQGLNQESMPAQEQQANVAPNVDIAAQEKAPSQNDVNEYAQLINDVESRKISSPDTWTNADEKMLSLAKEKLNSIAQQQGNIYEEKTSQTPSTKKSTRVLGNSTEIVLPDNTTLPAQWEIVDADNIKATIKEGVNQPRDRTRASSDVQIREIFNNLDYRRLSDSPVLDIGAPAISHDGLIVAGNGRFEAVSLAHDKGTASDYLDALKNDAVNKGIDPAAISEMKKPVLVRRITQPYDTRKLAIDSNAGASLQYSGMELAKIDADRMKGVEDLDITDTGDIALTGSNISKLKQSLGGYNNTELSSLVDRSGALSQDGVRRVRNSLLAKAYGDSDTLGRLVESTDNDARNVLGALTRSAGVVAKVRSNIKAGAIPKELDITNSLLDAVETLSQIRTKGQPLEQYLAQDNLFGDDIDADSKEILKFLHDNIRSQKKLTAFIKDVYGQISDINQSTEDIFGDNAIPSKQDVIQNAKQSTEEQTAEQQDIFAKQPSQANEQAAKTKAGDAGSSKEAQSDTGLKFSRSPEERIKDRERSRQLESKLRKQGYNFTIKAKDVRDFAAMDRGRQNEAIAAEQIAKNFGKRVVWIEATGEFKINGVMIPSIKDTIFIDVTTDKYAHAVMGHELSHHMERDAPDAYKALVKSLESLIRNNDEYADTYGIKGADKDYITKEIVGDLVGDNFTDQKFWNKVAEYNPNVFRKIADTIISWLKNLVVKAKSRGLGSERWVTDAQEAQDIIARSVAKYTNKESSFDGLVNKPMFQKAWHGSPHDHDKFDSSKIGTGEGAQVYGYGHYFAGSRAVAEWYQHKLAVDFKQRPITFNGKIFDYDLNNSEFVALHLMRLAKNGLSSNSRINYKSSSKDILNIVVTDIRTAIKSLEDQKSFMPVPEKEMAIKYDAIAFLETLSDSEIEQIKPFTGRLYEVELAPEQDEYLLWDKPLSEQSEKVKQALAATGLVEATPKEKKLNQSQAIIDLTGEGLYNQLTQRFKIPEPPPSWTVVSLDTEERAWTGQKKTSQYLHSLGIRGIKYLDGTSRSKGEKSYNYVIFDDKDIEITAKFSRQTKNEGNDYVTRGGKNLSRFEGDGKVFETGAPVTFNYLHNKESATKLFGKPRKDSAFGRFYEPSGKYVVQVTDDAIAKQNPNQYEYGELSFNNPLVIANNDLSWKEELSKVYDGKTGKQLSKALIADGYDGVVTVDKYGTSEILDLTSFDESKAKFSKAEQDYRMEHKSPGREGNAPLSDLTGDGLIYPDDVYSNKAVQYYGTGDDKMDRQSFEKAKIFRGKPDAIVEIYRAVPEGVGGEINSGDWVTINKNYAKEHGESYFDGNYDILSKKVRAGDIFTNGDSIHEWGYEPDGNLSPELPLPMFGENNRLTNMNKDGATWSTIVRENPALELSKNKVTVFRATVGDSIRINDFVALNKSIAEQHLDNLKDRGEGGKIIAKLVLLDDLLMANDATEFVYYPKNNIKFSKARKGSIEDVMQSWEGSGVTGSASEKNGIITLNKIIVPKDKRNAGIGTAAMRELINYADATDQQIALTPSADFGGNKSKLQFFYRKLGFKKNKEFGVMESLIRDPGQVNKESNKQDLTIEQQSFNFGKLNLDYGDIEQRPGTTGKQRSEGRNAYQALLERIANRAGARVLGLAIAKDFKEQGGSSLIGQQVKASDDLATVAQVLRDPRYETFRVFYVKDNKIIHHTGITSRLPGMVNVASKMKGESESDAVDRFIDSIAKQKETSGADGYYLLHNHPSGRATPSQGDKNVTIKIANEVPGFISHVVINSNEYSVIHDNGDSEVFLKELSGGYGSDALIPHNVLQGRVLNSPSVMAEIGKTLQRKDGFFTLLGLSAQNQIISISEVPLSALNQSKTKLLAMVRVFARNSGSISMAVVTDPESSIKFKDAVKAGVLLDVVDTDGNSLREIVTTTSDRLFSRDYDKPGMRAEQQDANIPETINIDGVDRPTRNSEGKLIHPTEEGIRNFYEWFAGSVVTDTNGRPRVVYHGTGKTFNKIKVKKGAQGIFWFSSDKESIESGESGASAISAIMPLYVKIVNPAGWKQYDNLILDEFKGRGLDGAILPRGEYDFDGFILDGSQVKSAERNTGSFSSDTDDIRFSRAEKQKEPLIPESKFRKFQRFWQDDFNRFVAMKEWLADRGINLSEQADVSRAEERYHSKVANQIEDFNDFVARPLIEKIAKAGFSMADVADYLEAQHAEEANDVIAKLHKDPTMTAYGIKTDEAEDYLSKAPKELGVLANEFRNITEKTKKLLLDEGLRSQEEVDAWEAAYKHYIPVKGGDQPAKGTGKGLSVNSKTKRRLGHGRRDEAVIENILLDYNRAVIEVEKNRIAKHLGMMAAKIAMPELMTIGQPVKRKALKNAVAYEVQVKGVTRAVFDSREGANVFKQMLPATDKKIVPSEIIINPTRDQRIISSASPMLAENEINMYIDGHAIRIQINDEIAARAYKHLGIEGYGHLVAAGRAINGYLSKAYTGYAPEWGISNIIRDFTAGIINLTGEEGIVMAVKAVKNYPGSFASLLRYAFTGRKQSNKWIDMYRANGGNTGAAWLPDMERLSNDVSSEYAAFQGVISNLKQGDMANASRAALRKLHNVFLKWLNNLNQASENAMRLSAFRAMIESGKSVNEASHIAKNITINFNKKGEFGQTANAAYLFFNATMNGQAAMNHALFKGKHKYQAWALGGAGLTALGYTMAAMLGGGDEDEYDKLDDYTKERNMVIKSGDGWIKIPVPYGHGFFWSLGRSIADAQRKDELGTLPWHIASSAIEELTPFGSIVVGSDEEFKSDQVLLGLLPTVAQIAVQPALNKSIFSGGEMMPESPFDKSQPDREKMWRGTKGTMYDKTSGWLKDAGIDVSPETLKHLTRSATGGAGATADAVISAAMLKTQGAEMDANEVPFVRKLYHEPTIRSDRAAFNKAREEAKTAAEEFRRAKRDNDLVSINKILKDKKEMIMLDNYANKLQKYINFERDQQDAVKVDESIPVAERRLKLKLMESRESKFYDQYLDIFKTNKTVMKERLK